MGLIQGEERPELCDCEMAMRLDEAADFLIRWAGSWNPIWRERLDIVIEETGWIPLQHVGNYIIDNLENGRHLHRVNHWALMAGTRPTPPRDGCYNPACGKSFRPQWNGQRFCSNACADAVMPNPRPPLPKHLQDPQEQPDLD